MRPTPIIAKKHCAPARKVCNTDQFGGGGKTTKTITGKLAKGVVTFSVPKLAKGTWKVKISWPGDASYAATSATGTAIKVTK